MSGFRLSAAPIDAAALSRRLHGVECGGCVIFEGRVRERSEGRQVLRLEYEAYAPLAEKEGNRILGEALERFDIGQAWCQHRTGALGLGELAVWVGVAAAHRDAAFVACRFIIDEIKWRVPIWKKEYYRDGDSGWVGCPHRAGAADGPERRRDGAAGA